MKIVSSLVFAAALISTWSLSRNPGPMPQSVHVGIQNDLKNIIAEYVQKNLPESKNLRFDKFWTEAIKKNKIRASFVYSFDDTSAGAGNARVEISGSAILNKVDENVQTVTYSLDELQILDNQVEFNEPVQITAGTANSTTPATEPPPAEEGK